MGGALRYGLNGETAPHSDHNLPEIGVPVYSHIFFSQIAVCVDY